MTTYKQATRTLLGGKVVCGECGGRMVGRVSSSPTSTYSCPGNKKNPVGVSSCPGVAITRTWLDEHVTNQLLLDVGQWLPEGPEWDEMVRDAVKEVIVFKGRRGGGRGVDPRRVVIVWKEYVDEERE